MADRTEEIKKIEGPIGPILEMILKEERTIQQRMSNGEPLIEKETDQFKKARMQEWMAFLENHRYRFAAARQILDQTAVLIVQDDGGYIVVTRVDDKTMALIKRAEELGGHVVSVEKTPKQELLL